MAIVETKNRAQNAISTASDRISNGMTTHRAHLRYLHIAPRKVRLIADTIRGLRVQEAEARLLLSSQRSARPLLKLLRSAKANAVNNKKAAPETLLVSAIWVDQGPIMKRSLPRAQGRATPLHKKSSHVTIILAESAAGATPRFSIEKKAKKTHHEHEQAAKRRKQRSMPAEGGSETRAEKPKPKKPGIFKRIFQRKSV